MTIHEREFLIHIGPIKIGERIGSWLPIGTEKLIKSDNEINFIPSSRRPIPTCIRQVARVDTDDQISIGAVTTAFTGETTPGTKMATLRKSEINSPRGQSFVEGKLVWRENK